MKKLVSSTGLGELSRRVASLRSGPVRSGGRDDFLFRRFDKRGEARRGEAKANAEENRGAESRVESSLQQRRTVGRRRGGISPLIAHHHHHHHHQQHIKAIRYACTYT
ncbi:hypothetical protein V9T40_013076 [Parthenolecanium corni]|uniref:Uncharacterized protein n=1 Tax=Parthenolecanium corni TaxID=536013 RepID=A0AAN9TKN7_9HEMI